jgi:hypothetical protein
MKNSNRLKFEFSVSPWLCSFGRVSRFLHFNSSP